MKKIKNMSDSARNRLLRISKETGKDYNAILLLFFQERLLYRLSISQFRNNFILKGGLLLRSMNVSEARHTSDVDFLGVNTTNNQSEIHVVFRRILMIPCNDGIEFDIDSLQIKPIAENAKYPGWRLFCNVSLGQIRQHIHFDIGFSDVVVPNPIQLIYPSFLSDLPSPEILMYSFESAIAEKFEAIVSLKYQTSRMKDFYDIHFMSDKQSFEAGVLRKAIHATFDNRNTRLSDYREVFTEDYRGERQKQIQWKAFLRKTGIPSELSFSDCVAGIEKFLDPVLCSDDLNAKWNPELRSWEPKEGD